MKKCLFGLTLMFCSSVALADTALENTVEAATKARPRPAAKAHRYDQARDRADDNRNDAKNAAESNRDQRQTTVSENRPNR